MKKSISRIISLSLCTVLLVMMFIPMTHATEPFERVIFFDDFSEDTMSDYDVIQQTEGASVSISDGKLHLDSSESNAHYVRILLPEDVQSDNIRITVKSNYVASNDNNRWLAVMFNVQDGADYKPYNQFAIRKTLNRNNGLEHAQPAATWNVKEKFQIVAPMIEPDVDMESVVHLYNGYCALVYNGTVVRDELALSSPQSLSGGRVGLQVNGLHAAIDSIEITETRDRYEAEEGDDNVKLVGYQTSEIIDGKCDLRIIGIIDTYEYDAAEFVITAKVGEDEYDLTTQITKVFNSLNARDGDDKLTSHSAADFNGNYLVAVTIKGVPANLGNITFIVTPRATLGETVYTGATVSFTLIGGFPPIVPID